MESENKKSDTSLAALIHLSTFSKYFIPFGNFIIPLIIWSSGKKDKLIDHHGKQAINFQISLFLYMAFVVFATIAGVLLTNPNLVPDSISWISGDTFGKTISPSLPFFLTLGVSGILLLGLFILELICVILATMKASNGEFYKYPITIPFINSSHQSKNDQFNNTQKDTL